MASKQINLWVLQPHNTYFVRPIRVKARKLPTDHVATVVLTPNHVRKSVRVRVKELCDYTGSKYIAIQREDAKIDRVVRAYIQQRFPGYKLVH